MPEFRYTAVTRTGETVTGTHEAADRQAVIDWLAGQQYLPLRAEPVGGGVRLTLGGRKVSRKRLAHLTRELATLLGAGLPLDRALELLIRLSRAEEAALTRRLLARVRDGKALSAAMAAEGEVGPADYAAIARAGEAGASLAAALARLAEGLERAQATREQVQSALIYPAFLLAAALGSVLLMLVAVIPSFAPLFEQAGRQLPASTQILLAASGFAETWAPIGLLALVLGGLGVARLPPEGAARRRVDRTLTRWPLIGPLVTGVQAGRFARTLGMLIGNGVGLAEALDLARPALSNRYFRSEVAAAGDAVKAGARLGERLALIPGWPRLAAELVTVGEETSRLPDMLLKAADILETEATRTVERLVAALTPALTLGIGLLVAGIVVSLLSAVMAVNDLAL